MAQRHIVISMALDNLVSDLYNTSTHTTESSLKYHVACDKDHVTRYGVLYWCSHTTCDHLESVMSQSVVMAT